MKRKLKVSLTVLLTCLLFISCEIAPKPSETIKIGDIGPAGGYVFYDKGEYSDGWRYLEAAPASSEFPAAWGFHGVVCPGTENGIGKGSANTRVMIELLEENGETGKVAQRCETLSINGYSDWFLPSKDELNEMYLQLCVGKNRGGFNISGYYPAGWYWSSSAYSDFSFDNTWCLRFSDGTWNYRSDAYFNRSDTFVVRAVRSF